MKYRHLLERSTGIPFTTGNKVEVLKNGDEIFSSMLASINAARHTIDFLTFVYWSGPVAEKFAKTLAEKAREGLKVRVLLDSYGAFPMPRELISILEDSGAELVWFRPLSRWKIWKSDNRTHRKILVTDNTTAFTGGVGIAEEWEGDARSPEEWRDTHFKIQGPAVRGIKSAFIDNWIESGHKAGTLLDEKFPEPTEHNKDDSATEKGTAIQTISTAATVRWSNIMLLYQSLIHIAEERIRITTAYFNPDETLVDLLKEKAEQGVKVQILIPGQHTDQRVTKIAAEDQFENLLSSGVELFYYQKTMLHAKIILIDDELSCVGSANFNQRSMLKDDEINLVLADRELNSTLAGHFDEDLNESEPVTNHRWKKRSAGRRLLETLIKPFKQEL